MENSIDGILYELAFKGEIVEKSMKGDKLVFSGYISTDEVDLTGDRCPAESWRKYLEFYNRNPIYCYNHDRTIPIGKCREATIDNKGLLFNDITLTPIPFVKDVLMPLILDDVLKQQSAGFMNLKQSKKSGVTILEENYLLEGSLVPVAMNPNGTDIKVKGIELFTEEAKVYDLWTMYDKGLIEVSSKVYSVPDSDVFSGSAKISQNNADTIMPTNTFTPMFKGIEVTKHIDSSYDPGGVKVDFPKNYASTAVEYTKAAELTHAGKQKANREGVKDKYIFQIGHVTEKGFAYDWNMLATTTAKVLGAKGGAIFEEGEQLAVLKRLEQAYAVLEKQFPQYEKTGETLSYIPEWKLTDIKYAEVKFFNDEDIIVADTIAHENIDSLNNYIEKNGPDRIKTELKYLSHSVNLNISGGKHGEYDSDGENDSKLMTQVLHLLHGYQQTKDKAKEDFHNKLSSPGEVDYDAAHKNMKDAVDHYVTNCLSVGADGQGNGNDMDLDSSQLDLDQDEIIKGKSKKEMREANPDEPEPLAVAAQTENDEAYLDPDNIMGTLGAKEPQGENDLNPEIRNRSRQAVEAADSGHGIPAKTKEEIEAANKKARKDQSTTVNEVSSVTKDKSPSKYNHMDDRGGKATHYAGPHNSFPIENQNDVDDAWDLRGHADNPSQVGRNVLRLAAHLGLNPPKGYHPGETKKAKSPKDEVVVAEESNDGTTFPTSPPSVPSDGDADGKKKKTKFLYYLSCVKYLGKDNDTRYGYVIGTTDKTACPVILRVEKLNDQFKFTKHFDITDAELTEIPQFDELNALQELESIVEKSKSILKAFDPIQVITKDNTLEYLDRLFGF
ncbi:MAG TPA: hypothetical protein VKR58_05920 [Aquella sp.]|nr:hypothetical protein [Aquella sp.]